MTRPFSIIFFKWVQGPDRNMVLKRIDHIITLWKSNSGIDTPLWSHTRDSPTRCHTWWCSFMYAEGYTSIVRRIICWYMAWQWCSSRNQFWQWRVVWCCIETVVVWIHSLSGGSCVLPVKADASVYMYKAVSNRGASPRQGEYVRKCVQNSKLGRKYNEKCGLRQKSGSVHKLALDDDQFSKLKDSRPQACFEGHGF